MIKRIIHYQKLLFTSPDSPNTKYSYVLMLIMIPIIIIFKFPGSLYILPGQVMVYMVATNSKRPYSLVPVSKRFALLNLYLVNILTTIFMYLILAAVSIFFYSILISFESESSDTEGDIGIKTIMFYIIIALITIVIITSISAIRNKKKRVIAFLIYDVTYISIYICIAQILNRFDTYEYANLILIFSFILLLVITPLLYMYAFKEYMKEVV